MRALSQGLPSIDVARIDTYKHYAYISGTKYVVLHNVQTNGKVGIHTLLCLWPGMLSCDGAQGRATCLF